MIRLTNHSILRAKERFLLSPALLKREAIDALENGVYLLEEDALSPLFLKAAQKNNSLPYLYKGIVFVFIDDLLITVYPINGRNDGNLF